LSLIATLVLAAGVLSPSEPRELVWPGEEGAAGVSDGLASTQSSFAIERCDGTRSPLRAEPAHGCTRWKVEWSSGGRVWGVTSGSSLSAVVKEREKILGYVRQSAKLFDVPVDAKWSSPTQPLCDACDPMRIANAAAGTPVTPDAAPLDEGVKNAWLDAKLALSRFETTVLETHAQRIRDVARLAQEPATAKLAKAYAKQLDTAVLELAQQQLALDKAAVFRSAAPIKKIIAALEVRTKALESSSSVLAAVVAKTAARQHAGRYTDESATTADKPQLVVAFAGDKVTATLVVGEAESQWFEGTVGLDGGIVGRSLVAPESGTLSCNAHSEQCGYAWAPAMLRFADRDSGGSKKHLVELWFQQSAWVHAKPFSR
jgi:hypothetical protein